jgi:LPS-assembly lipoprotein
MIFYRKARQLYGLAATLLFVALGGCGFQPMMSRETNPAVQENLAKIRIDTIPDRSGQILRNYLLDDLTPRGVQGLAQYRLVVLLTEPRRDAAIQRDNTASRIIYSASTSFQLVDQTASRVVFVGTSSSETTYEVTTSEFATLSSLNGARDRVLQDVSADIRQQIADFFGRAVRVPVTQPVSPASSQRQR